MRARVLLAQLVACSALTVIALSAAPAEAPADLQASHPNIVLMFPGQPRLGRSRRLRQRARRARRRGIDKLAAEGIRLNNFNVEFSCTVSRAALLTGRYAIRTGATQASGHHAVGNHDRRSAASRSATRPASSASGISAATRPRASASRPIRASTSATASRARATRRRRRSPDSDRRTPGTSFIWEGQGRRSRRATSSCSISTTPAHDRSRGGEAQHRVHGAQRPRSASRSSCTTR